MNLITRAPHNVCMCVCVCVCVCVCLCAHLLSFHKVCYYDDGGYPELPDHPPEVFNVVRKRSLAGNVCAGFSVALGGGEGGEGRRGGGEGEVADGPCLCVGCAQGVLTFIQVALM